MADDIYRQISAGLKSDAVKFTVAHLHSLYTLAINSAESHPGDKRAYALKIISDVLTQLKDSGAIKATDADNIIADALKYGPIAIDLAVAGSKGLLAINKKGGCCW